MENEILNPNCSEVVWRLEVKKNTREAILKALEPDNDDNEELFTTNGDDYPNGCVDNMIREMDGAMNIDDVKIIYEESQGREGVYDYTEECFEIAKRFVKGEIKRDEADELEKEAWRDNVDIHRGIDE